MVAKTKNTLEKFKKWFDSGLLAWIMLTLWGMKGDLATVTANVENQAKQYVEVRADIQSVKGDVKNTSEQSNRNGNDISEIKGILSTDQKRKQQNNK